jgi:hypothetical protein
MNIKRTWVVVGATIGIAGFAGAGIAMASDDVELQDPEHAPVVQLTGDSANSPNAPSGPVERGGSADSAADSPGEAGYSGPGAGGSADSAADSPGEAVPPPPAPPAQQAPPPAPAPAPVKVASADSPAPAPVQPRVHSGDSGNSGSSAGSAGSAD